MRLTAEQLDIIRAIFSKEPVIRAYIFGSYARNEADGKSDIDILVELDYSQRIGLGFVGIQQELEEQLNAKVDLVSARGLSSRIKPYIDREKQMIYEKVAG